MPGSTPNTCIACGHYNGHADSCTPEFRAKRKSKDFKIIAFIFSMAVVAIIILEVL